MKNFNSEQVLYTCSEKSLSINYNTFLILRKQYKHLEKSFVRFFISKKIKTKILLSILLFSEIVIRFDIYREIMKVIKIIPKKNPSSIGSYSNQLNLSRIEYRKYLLTKKPYCNDIKNYHLLRLKKSEKKMEICIKTRLCCTMFQSFINFKLKIQFLSYFAIEYFARKFLNLKKINSILFKKVDYFLLSQRFKPNYNFLNLHKISIILFYESSRVTFRLLLVDYLILYFAKTWIQKRFESRNREFIIEKGDIVNKKSLFSSYEHNKFFPFSLILKFFFEDTHKSFYFLTKKLTLFSKISLKYNKKRNLLIFNQITSISKKKFKGKTFQMFFLKSWLFDTYIALTKNSKIRLLFHYFFN